MYADTEGINLDIRLTRQDHRTLSNTPMGRLAGKRAAVINSTSDISMLEQGPRVMKR